MEAARHADDPQAIDLAIRRILMGHALIASFGGIPLIYMGDELGSMNDCSDADDPALADDSRWMQRPVMDWAKADTRHDVSTPHGRIYQGVRHIMATRKGALQLASDIPTRVVDCGNPAVFCYQRLGNDRQVTCLANFTKIRSGRHWLCPKAPLIC